MDNGDGITTLSLRHTNSLINYIDKHSVFSLILQGIVIYLLLVFIFSILFFITAKLGYNVIENNGTEVTDFWGILYFNLITVLAIGYEEYAPIGVGRFFAITEAIFSYGLFAALIGIIILKLTQPAKDSVVFSKYCYYIEDEERFVVVFINTNRKHLINSEMFSLLKVNRDFILRPGYKTPYIGNSAWTFGIDFLSKDKIQKLTIWPDDGIKFGITGSYGFANFAASMKYSFDKVYVLKTRKSLTSLKLLREPDFKDPKMKDEFHYIPQDKITFLEYAKDQGAKIKYT